MNNEIIMTLSIAGTAVLSAVVGFLGKFIQSKLSATGIKFIENVANDILNKIIERYIPDSVAFANQQFVDGLRQSGAWKPKTESGETDEAAYKENQAQAIQIAYNSLIGCIPVKYIDTLNKVFADAETLLKTKIEAYIRNSKKRAPTVKATTATADALL